MPSPLASLQPGLMLLQGHRLEDLRDLLNQWLTHHPLMLLENEPPYLATLVIYP